ncbi:MAG: hypothetical protein WBS18_07590 [Candidatus Acidiferrales bacterium]
MSAYNIVLFIHLLGALALFAAFTIEGLSIRGLRAAKSLEDLRTWLAAARKSGPLALFAVLAILLGGGYLAGRLHAWGQGWIQVSLGLVVLIGAIGAPLTAPRLRAIRSLVLAPASDSFATASSRAHASFFLVSFDLRVAFAVAAVFLMSTKIELLPSLVVVAVAIVLAVIAAMIHRSRSSS